jgi:heme-degrading monooxygenase HmoA
MIIDQHLESINSSNISHLHHNHVNDTAATLVNSSCTSRAPQVKQEKPKLKSSPFQKKNGDQLRVDFRPDWCDRVEFEICDAAKFLEKYVDSDGNDFTHIYSYNKVMSLKDRRGISKILNRTNYRLLAWYFGPDHTRDSGLKHFQLIHQEPMQSTGKEKFTVYVYYKTRRYQSDEAAEHWLDSSDEEEVDEEKGDNEDQNEEESETSKDKKPKFSQSCKKSVGKTSGGDSDSLIGKRKRSPDQKSPENKKGSKQKKNGKKSGGSGRK